MAMGYDPKLDPALQGMKPPQKFCADCKWCSKYSDMDVEFKSFNDWECTAEAAKVHFNLVSGDPRPNYCVDMRLRDECGPAGNLWEPAEIKMD